MVTGEAKSRYEKRIDELERDREKVLDLVKELIAKIAQMKRKVGDREAVGR